MTSNMAANNNVMSKAIDDKIARNLPPEEGCVVLGLDGPKHKQYATRYTINHEEQRRGLCRDILYEKYFPCCDPDTKETCARRAWSFVSSEVVLFSLHISTVTLSIIKITHPLVKGNKQLELIQSVFELIVTCLLLILRTAAGWVEYQELKESIYRHEHIVDKRYAKGRHIKLWLILYTASSLVLIILVIIGFVALYLTDYLYWIILISHTALILILATSGLFQDRINFTMKKISEDQHKAIIAESLLLMKEGYAANTAEEKEKYLSRANAFSEALATHESFCKPDYIDIHPSYVRHNTHL